MSDEADNERPDSQPEELLPDERPQRTPERAVGSAEGPLQLEAATVGLPPPHRRSRGRAGRDPICSKYRMAWVMVFFDLPVGSREERKAASDFRKDLVKDGYIMVQFSVYARPCGTADRVDTHVRRLRSKIPSKGEVRGLLISDAQWGRMIVVRGQRKVDAEKMPEQMMFF